jgi:hypothetical protein
MSNASNMSVYNALQTPRGREKKSCASVNETFYTADKARFAVTAECRFFNRTIQFKIATSLIN